jgi:hypothetical protein
MLRVGSNCRNFRPLLLLYNCSGLINCKRELIYYKFQMSLYCQHKKKTFHKKLVCDEIEILIACCRSGIN